MHFDQEDSVRGRRNLSMWSLHKDQVHLGYPSESFEGSQRPEEGSGELAPDDRGQDHVAMICSFSKGSESINSNISISNSWHEVSNAVYSVSFP